MFGFIRRLLERIRELLARIFGWGRPEPIPPPETCPIGWQPSVLAPVFYGIRDYGPARDVVARAKRIATRPRPDVVDLGAPTRIRVFFPSLDGAVWDAPILEGCGRYPLIVLAHGNCAEPAGDHYTKWYQLPVHLARSGYVVAVPLLSGTAGGAYPWDNDAEVQLLKDVITWMRDRWEHRSVLMPEPATGVIGHSYGGLLAGRLAIEAGLAAYVSLSGAWSEWPEVPPNPVRSLAMPKLFTWGSGLGDVQSQYDGVWSGLPMPRHKAVIEGAGHWDYLAPGASSCERDRGPCTLVQFLASDVVALFFGKYLPPELWPDLGDGIPDSLLPPPLSLTDEQKFYASGHLSSFSIIGSREGCGVTLAWTTSAGSGSVTRP
jgi:pimeloyl-ACP methyl ester carboxylesterase